ncbi:MAG TPA: type II toxin-antitoxin system RelE/ParE family toxin [Phycisphaerae bacterium]|nr:type II toxin-antitoxin system RelE/ParE family toxin [Phycisphaerae bacterium]
MHKLLIERRAERELSELSPSMRLRIARAIAGLRENPRPAGCRKLVGSESDWRIRVGEYRVVYEIDVRTVVRVFRIRHRKDAYK